jgi:hypothetical protein
MMATIALFYGIIISMFYKNNRQHSVPHIHANYQGQNAVLSILDGEILAGDFPPRKLKLVRARIEIHYEDLLADWELAVNCKSIFAIEPLR